MLTSKCKWKNLSLGLIFVSSFLISGCPAIQTKAPLLTEKNADSIEGVEGYYYLFNPDDEDKDTNVGYLKVSATEENNKYEYSFIFETGYQFLRFIKLDENWFLLQSSSKEGNDKGKFLWFVEREGKRASLYVNKSDYKLNLEGFPNLVGHVTQDNGNLTIDETVAATLNEDVIKFLKREFFKYKINLDNFLELGPSDERTVYKYWCQQAVKEIYSKRNWKSAKEDIKLKSRIEYSVNTCKHAVDLNPGIVELKHNYGKALHKAERFSEALEWLNK